MQKKISVWRNGLKAKSSKPARITSRSEASPNAVRAAIFISAPPSNLRIRRVAFVPLKLWQTQIHPDKVAAPGEQIAFLQSCRDSFQRVSSGCASTTFFAP